MIPIESLIIFSFSSLVLCLAPGPDNFFVLFQSALYGSRSGLYVTLGLCTGLVIHTLIVALGIAVILQTSVITLTLFKVIGALYLLYLAWRAFSASMSPVTHDQKCLASAKLYQIGVVMNVSNPKISLFFLAFLPQFVVSGHIPVEQQIALLGGIFILMTLLVFGGIAFFAGRFRRWFNRSPKAFMYLNWIAGTVLIILAGRLLTLSN